MDYIFRQKKDFNGLLITKISHDVEPQTHPQAVLTLRGMWLPFKIYSHVFDVPSFVWVSYDLLNENEYISRAFTSEYAAGYLPLCRKAMGMWEEAANGLGKERRIIFKSFSFSRSSLCNIHRKLTTFSQDLLAIGYHLGSKWNNCAWWWCDEHCGCFSRQIARLKRVQMG